MDASKLTELFFSGDNLSFEHAALEIFNYQYESNPVYRQFVQLNDIAPETVHTLTDIPFLPVQFFKSHRVISGDAEPKVVFESSGTTGQQPARHFVADPELYRRSFTEGFRRVYGDPGGWHILALLPGYLERGHSSLVYMFEELIRLSGSPLSGFYLHDHEQLQATLQAARDTPRKTLLLGVTYSLLDFADRYPQDLSHAVIMETGGMKGRRAEMLREDVHAILKKAFRADKIHSEYGMTELLSQAWSSGDGLFRCPPWMRMLQREINDYFAVSERPGRGALNIIDLANVHSCSFLATQDVGQLNPDGTFEVLGRTDNSDLRGCNLMVTT